MITYQIEDVRAVLKDVENLFDDHYEEVAENKEHIKLNPDFDKYIILEEEGALHVATVRDDDKLVGYCVSILNIHIHYKDHLFALNDIFYLAPKYRSKGIAKGLLSFTEDDLKEVGVSVTVMHMKCDHPFKELVNSLGFKKTEYMFSKYIGKKEEG